MYDYCALVPVIEGAGGRISDWTGAKLTLDNHENSKGRVLCSANSLLHCQALEILNTPMISSDDVLLPPDDELLSALNNGDVNVSGSNNAPLLLCGVVLGEMLSHATMSLSP